MSNYSVLKALLDTKFYENSDNEITGTKANEAVKAMVDSLGAGYQFIGVATPNTTPSNTDIKQFYIACTPGTYDDFLDAGSNPLVMNDSEVAVLKYDTAWSKDLVWKKKAEYLSSPTGVDDYFSEFFVAGLGAGDYYLAFNKVSASSRYFQILDAPVLSNDHIVAQGYVETGKDFCFLVPYLGTTGISGIVKMSGDMSLAVTSLPALINKQVSTDISYSDGIQEMLKELRVGTSASAHTDSLVKAVTCGAEVKDTRIFVENGNIDLMLQYHQAYGWSFFTGYTTSNPNVGLVLKNRIKIYFSQDSTVSFLNNYVNEGIMKNFSPFNSGANGFEIHGLNISAKNCRYCIHDERSSAPDSYVNIYQDCVMYIDNTGNTFWTSKQCIGGGLGLSGDIRINGCIFESEGIDENTNGIVSYHNAVADNARSFINVSDCYFRGIGTFRLSWYGVSTLITKAIVAGNNLGGAIIHRAERPQDYDTHNTELLAWNNIIR